ncbi:MAG: carbohydrate-binding domain-containing protein [Clostridia bacterium]|nr:carbohydrate-binding domain-containing protein [Clostridia bacterium]
MKKTTSIITLLTVAILLLTSCAQKTDITDSSTPLPEASAGELPEDISRADMSNMDFEFTDRDKNQNGTNGKILTPEEVDGEYLITKEGTYLLSGEINNKTVHIKAQDTDKIQLVLDGVTISNTNSPAIYIESADKVFITLNENTENEITVGETMQDETLDGAIFSRADLTINGSGSLDVKSDCKHGIVSKDDLVIVDSTVNVTSKNVSLDGKDCVKISNATLNLQAGSDGIRSDNAEDASRGYVYIESGKINIVSSNDGIQAETAIKIQNGEFNIVSGNGSNGRLTDSTESYKGIKASSDVLIHNGNFNIDSLDDAIHSNNTICIEGGKFNLKSSDDGIHADADLAISSGEIIIAKSYEGLESSRIFVSGGSIDIIASDDGLNAAGGNDASAENNPFGQEEQGGFGKHQGGFGKDVFDNGIGEIVISGGYLHINASGDGVDSNGSFTLSGGVVLVSGPTNNGNGAFDYGKSAKVTGGILMAAGSSGMAQGFSEAENQGAMLVTVGNQNAKTSIALCDEDGNCIVTFIPIKSYQTLVVTSPEIKQGGKYKILVGATAENTDSNGYAHNTTVSNGTTASEITMTELIYGNGGFGGGGFGGGMGRPNGNPPTPPDGTPPDGAPSGGRR